MFTEGWAFHKENPDSDPHRSSIFPYKILKFVPFVLNVDLFRGQLHFHGSPMDIAHGSIYGKCQGSLADCGFGGGNVEKVSDLRMQHGCLSG